MRIKPDRVLKRSSEKYRTKLSCGTHSSRNRFLSTGIPWGEQVPTLCVGIIFTFIEVLIAQPTKYISVNERRHAKDANLIEFTSQIVTRSVQRKECVYLRANRFHATWENGITTLVFRFNTT